MTESRMSQRRMDLDYAKGIAIIFMIFMHTGNPSDCQLKIIISAFFMPIFYIICGILVAIKNPTGLNKVNFSEYIVKRSRQILIPYFMFGLLLIAFFQGLHLIVGEPLTIKCQLFRLFTLQGIESMWFLTRYFLAEMMFLFFFVKLPKFARACFVVCSISIISTLNAIGMPAFWLLRLLIGAWLGLIFVYFGFVIEHYQLISKLRLGPVFLIMVACIVSAIYNGFIGVGALSLQNGILFFVNAIGLSIVLLYFCNQIKVTNILCSLLTIFGKNTIVIVCTNNLLIEIIRLIDYKVMGNILIRLDFIGNCMFAILLMSIEYILIFYVDGNLAFLFGRRRYQ